jgi:hypothetical protein
MIEVSPFHPFSFFNVPFGIASIKNAEDSNNPQITAVFSRYGDYGINLLAAAAFGAFKKSSFADKALDIFCQVRLGNFLKSY